MIDINEDKPSPVGPAATPTLPSAGTQLRMAREAAGIHIGALAVALKVSVAKLEALEADDLAQLPDAVFARALAASVCRTLRIDVDPVLQMLPQLHAPSMPAGLAGRSVRLDNRRGLRASGSFALPKPVLMITAALLIAAVVVVALPTLRDAADRVTSGEGASPPGTTEAPNMVQVPVVPLPQTVASNDGAATAPAAAASAATPLPAVAPAASAPDAAAEPAAMAAFTARDKAWVQVVGADGVVHLRKTLDAGETVRINGAMPLSVVIGRADAIGVRIRGNPYDLTPVSKDNVARFQIK